jgi:hypothetical protein
MRVVTWVPGTDKKHDELFDSLREVRYTDQSHRLWKNFAREEFANVTALSIYFDDNNVPEVCSSILERDCWPQGAFRIHNRVWKPNNKLKFLRRVTDGMGYIALSQIAWLKEHKDLKLFFISRQVDTGWNDWMIKNFKEGWDIGFETDNYKYLTCQNECDDTCWQHIIYNGDTELLEQWKRRLNS